jgi:hypothetical protein
MVDIKIVATSYKEKVNALSERRRGGLTLKIPHTLSVTTDVRLIRKNSAIIIQNANTPPKSMIPA